MTKLPVCSGKEAIKAFERLGYHQDRQRGDHVYMKCEGRTSLSVPLHDPVAKGTLRKLISFSGYTVEEFDAQL